MDDLSRLRIPLATFARVFDTDPAREVVTLPELITTLTRFELKPEVQQRIERELERTQAAFASMRSGEPGRGRYAKRLAALRDEGARQGMDVVQALDYANEQLQKEIRKGVKRDIRLWSPALYKEGARRQQEDVTHISCLVMDHDDGTPLEVVREVWAGWFHIVHTTWSHRPEHPRFRVILPLSAAIEADRWEAVYEWAIARSEGVVDPTGKGRASTFAMPVIPGMGHPRVTYSHAGALLDPVAEGVIEQNDPPAPGILEGIGRPEPSFTGDPGRRYTSTSSGAAPPPAIEEGDSFEDQSLWDAVGGGELEFATSTPAALPPNQEAMARLSEWVEQVAPTAMLVDALERLEGLWSRGALSDDEYERAKAAVLADLDVHSSPFSG